MKPHIFLDEAALELSEAFYWYESRSVGLGNRFFEAAQSTVVRICEEPHSYPIAQGNIRSARVFGFPYSIFYTNEAEAVVIYAVFHQRRKPNLRIGSRKRDA